jgi:cell division protein FtsQ
MDRPRRLLRSLRETEIGFAPGTLAYAGALGALTLRESDAPRLRAGPRARRRELGPRHRFLAPLSERWATYLFVAALFLSTGLYGAVRGGHYAAFIDAQGDLPDIFAKGFGLGIKAVTITGQSELDEADILAAAGIGPRNSLPFLDVAKVRERLQQLPLIKDASVTKLYPHRLLIDVEERQPTALWQDGGQVNIIAADGMRLDAMRGQHSTHLPFVVGDGANAKLGEYLALLEAAGDLRDRIRAGILIAERRWNLKTTDGIDILLPEINPEAAVATLVKLQRESRVLDKDVLSLDLRQPGRMVARLTEDGAAVRAEMIAHKPTAKGGQT